MNRFIGARALGVFTAVAVAFALSATASGQTTGMIRGKVVDAKGEPIEGASITIEFQENVNRKHETKTNRRGEFIQIGLASGKYKVTASKEGVGSQSFDTGVRGGQPAEVNFQLAPGAPGVGATKEDAAKVEAFKKAFEDAVATSQAGQYDSAISQFQEMLKTQPDCYVCQYNIGAAYAQKKDYANAETAYKKTIEMKMDFGQAYTALANIYNAQRKFDEAAKMSAEATKYSGGEGGGGNAESVFNQAVILWNAGNIAEAKKNFEEAIKLKPDHAEAHYWLGMANLNEGKMPEATTAFEEYLKLASTGQYAEQAKAILSQIKK